ncbi:MAG: hypothetical protein L0H36_00735 [bacterium]|nr:hypothetical protein [bacterium]MDN5835142.1 hypothetical protein [bacterium]
MYTISSVLFHVGAFCIAVVVVIIGFTIIDFVRKMKQRNNAKRDPVHIAKSRLKFRQDHDDDYDQNQTEIKQRLDREKKENLQWALENSDDPVAFRYLRELRQDLVREVRFLEHVRVPDPSELHSARDAYRDQELAKLTDFESRIAKIDEVLPKVDPSKP